MHGREKFQCDSGLRPVVRKQIRSDQPSYKQLSDKSGIDEHAVTFPGFEGSNEAQLLHFAGALSKNNNYAETIGKDVRDSHMPTTDMYRRQISEWKNLGSPRYPFSKERVLKTIDTRTHSSNHK